MRPVGNPVKALLRRAYTLHRRLCWWWRRARAFAPWDGCDIARDARLGRNVHIQVTDQGRLTIERGVYIGDGVHIVVRGGQVRIGRDCHISQGVVITAQEYIALGADCLVGEYVTIRDQDHAVDAGNPINRAGYQCSPVRIGDNVWLGAKSSVLAGTTIGDGSVVGAHALVRHDLPCNVIAVGVPARILRSRGGAAGGG